METPRLGRCIVYRDPSAEGPVREYGLLLDALSTKGVRPQETTDAYGALADLLATGEGDSSVPAALLLVEPRRSAAARRLAEAALEHAPASALWSFDATENPRLTAYRLADGPAAAAPSEPPEETPSLRLAGTEAAPTPIAEPVAPVIEPEPPAPAGPPSPEEGLAALTEDEIAMLLAEEDPR